MKYPYGISDFKKINTKNYFYCDRTDKIPLLENSDFQLFIRPRRFGKSLVLSMLENYYDVAKKDEFEAIFGDLKIGKNPTELRNSYFILRFDFSCVDPTGSAEDVKRALFNHINVRIDGFYKFYNYKGFEIPNIEINREDALYSIDSLIASIRMTPYPIYLLIDEYDNFANTVMMGVQSPEGRYKALVHEEGPLRTFFKAVKASTSGSMFDRVFITGVSPVVMSDITSGYNIAKNIYFEPEFNDLCGFKQNEIEDVLKKIVDEFGAVTNVIVALEGPNQQRLAEVASQIAPHITDITISYYDDNDSLIVRPAFQRVDYEYDTQYLKKHGLMLMKADDLKKYKNIFNDYNLAPFWSGVNDFYESQWVSNSDNLTKQEKDAEQALEGMFELFDTMADFAYGKANDTTAVQKGIDAMTVGHGYYLSDDKKMMLMFVRPTMSADEITAVVAAADSLDHTLSRLSKNFPDVHIGLTGMHIIMRDEMHTGMADTIRNLIFAITLILIIFIFSFVFKSLIE